MPPSDDKAPTDTSDTTPTADAVNVPPTDEEADKKKKKVKFVKNGAKKGGKDEDIQSDALSDEDRDLKDRLEQCVTTVTGIPIFPPDASDAVKAEISAAETAKGPASTEIRLVALNSIATELRTATSSMTAVPKPLKFLRPHYRTLCDYYAGTAAASAPLFHARLGDVLSVLSMTMGDPDGRESLRYKLSSMAEYGEMGEEAAGGGGAGDYNYRDLGTWGHEYSRSLAGEIGREYSHRVNEEGADPDDDLAFADILSLVEVIVPFHVRHNAEVEAVDLLVEVQRLGRLPELAGEGADHGRICLYVVRMADFTSDPEDLEEMLGTAMELYRKNDKYFDALRMALRMGNESAVPELLAQCTDVAEKKQMCVLLGRHRSPHRVEDDEELDAIVGNEHLSSQFLALGRDLDVSDPKAPEDIYKSHLAETAGFSRRRDASGSVDSARANLASTFVSAFVNAGFGSDKLMTPEDSEWLYKNKDHGMTSAAASLGCVFLWNVEVGLNQVDKFLYSSEDHVKAGAALAVGILSAGVRNDGDPALALLEQHLEGDSHVMKCSAATGLGIAYGGSANAEAANLLLPLVEGVGEKVDMLEASLAGLALGMIFVGSCDENVGGTLVQRLMEATQEELDHKHTRFLCLGLGLLFLGKMEKADAMLEAVRTVEHSIAKYAAVTLETCAYAGTGNVLKVQGMLHQLTEHLTEDADHQAAAVIGISLIVMGEDVGSEMALRAFDHLLHYCEAPIKRAVPLALALLHVSNPDYSVIDTLSRLTHDPDPEMAQNAIMGLGLAGAGTNNSRVAGLLRQLSEFYGKDAGQLFCVRIAQGMLHMGKGLLTVSPFHSDRTLTCAPAMGALLVFMQCCLDMGSTLLGRTHYLLYYLTCAMSPRMLITVGEDMEWKPATVRVGQAVETVGVAGRPKTITGFQTHTTPVLLGAKDRAELGTEEFVAVGSVLEGIVILKENPDFVPEETS